METRLLIGPDTHSVVAKLAIDEKNCRTISIIDKWLLQVLEVNGIAVPKGFAEKRSYIYPRDEQLFGKAFEIHYFPRALQQRGYYWVKEEDYKGPEEQIKKLVDHALHTI